MLPGGGASDKTSQKVRVRPVWERRWERLVFVVELAGARAVVELAEK
jgi:hypothetical protein